MLSKKQIRMLEILDERIKNCQLCHLKQNGTAIPKWTKYSRYVVIGEAPVFTEIEQHTPFVGIGAGILGNELSRLNFDIDEFLIINSVQCRPKGKPMESQLEACKNHLRKYIKVVNPEKILCLGNFAKYIFTGNFYGILKERGKFEYMDLDKNYKYPTLFTVNPAFCIYNEQGVELLRKDLKLFKEEYFLESSNWFFKEEEFLI